MAFAEWKAKLTRAGAVCVKEINFLKIILTNFVKIISKKIFALTQTAPARVSFAFHSAKSHVLSNYRNQKTVPWQPAESRKDYD